MRLFLKIFLWFWLAMGLIVGAFFLVGWWANQNQNDPFRRQLQGGTTDTLKIQTLTAAQIYENEGEKGVSALLKRLDESDRISASGFFIDGKQISGGNLPKISTNVIEKTLSTNLPEISFADNEIVGAEKIILQNGQTAILVLQFERFRLPPQPNFRTLILQLIAIILTTGFVCYVLARYLVSPVVKLQQAVKTFSNGDLQTRIETKRRDEFGQLARDFNLMAERIESLISSQKTLNRDISHELRTPLARLGVALELARAKAKDETNPHFDRIELESYRLNEMIGQILTLSKLETGAENFQKTKVNLSKLVNEVVEDANFEASNQAKQVEILENQPCVIEGNERLLQSAIENLVRNAVKYTPENSNVEVSLKSENGTAEITVRDHGKGVEESKLKDLFRPFYRAEEARERKSGGVGLGLAITERAVNAYGGKVWAENAADRRGLIVKIKLPLNQNTKEQ